MSRIFGISSLPVAKMFPSVEPTDQEKYFEETKKALLKEEFLDFKNNPARDSFERSARKNFNEFEKYAKKLL